MALKVAGGVKNKLLSLSSFVQGHLWVSQDSKNKGLASSTPLTLPPSLAWPQASGQALVLTDSSEPRPPPATLPRNVVWVHEVVLPVREKHIQTDEEWRRKPSFLH